jgi:GNAT superfamily N-acetyltransferase
MSHQQLEDNPEPVIVQVQSSRHLMAVRSLFEAYAASLDFDLDFQNFKDELKNLPGEYAPPKGCILMAFVGKDSAGCVALRQISNEICEMKRLYIKPLYRKKGIGRCLAETVIQNACGIGYKRMRLDTVPAMKAARALYASLGFKKITAYRYNPIDGAAFMELDLKQQLRKRKVQGEQAQGQP